MLVLNWYLHEPESHLLSLMTVRHEVPKIVPQVYLGLNKLTSLEATLVRNYDPPTDRLNAPMV